MNKRHIQPIAIYRPLPWQVRPWRDKSGILLLTGAAGGGKSRLAAEKVHGYCKKYPGAMGLMLRKHRNSMTNSTVLFMERTVIGKDPAVHHYPSKLRFEYANGSILAYGGMADDEQREQIRSIGPQGAVDIIWMEEANRFGEIDFNEARGRIRGKAAPWRQVILTTNPDAPTHWIKQRLMDGGEASVYYSSARDNPHNAPEYLATLASLTGLLGKRLNKGLWVQAEGAVYETFSDELHVIDAMPNGWRNWRKIRAIDFGYTNPFVCLWFAIDGDGRMCLYREIYMTKRTVNEHAPKILALSQGEHYEATVCDHDAEDRATLEQAGIYNIPAVKDISRGIQAVEQRLKVAGDGKPRLFVLKNTLVELDTLLKDPFKSASNKPSCTLEEFPGYAWPRAADGKANKEVPIDINNHGMDALRYAVMYLDDNKTTAGTWGKRRQ